MITGPKKVNVYSRISKLSKSIVLEDLQLAREYLLENMFKLTPKQFQQLDTNLFKADVKFDYEYEFELCTLDIQKYWHDKWKEKRQTKQGDDIIED